MELELKFHSNFEFFSLFHFPHLLQQYSCNPCTNPWPPPLDPWPPSLGRAPPPATTHTKTLYSSSSFSLNPKSTPSPLFSLSSLKAETHLGIITEHPGALHAAPKTSTRLQSIGYGARKLQRQVLSPTEPRFDLRVTFELQR